MYNNEALVWKRPTRKSMQKWLRIINFSYYSGGLDLNHIGTAHIDSACFKKSHIFLRQGQLWSDATTWALLLLISYAFL